jgi:transposase
MYDWEPHVLLRHYLEQGLSKSAIAERIGISRRCIYKWIAQGDLDRDLPHPAAAGDLPGADGRPPLR